MESGKLESRISKWASRFGFTLPDGSAPQDDYFAPLTATPHRSRLWERIINTVESRQVTENIRKQIFVSRIKSKNQRAGPKDCMLLALHHATYDKIDLWNKKQELEKKIAGKKGDIEKSKLAVQNLARSMQHDVCRLAEKEKQCAECKEKSMALKLVSDDLQELLQLYGTLADRIKYCCKDRTMCKRIQQSNIMVNGSNFKGMIQCLCTIKENETCPIQNKIGNIAWADLVRLKKDNTERLLKLQASESILEDKKLGEGQTVSDMSVEKLMLDVTEKSLEAILYETELQHADMRCKEALKIASCNELPDVEKALTFLGLQRRLSFLQSEVQRIKEECKNSQSFLEERKDAKAKFLSSLAKLADTNTRLDVLKTKREASANRITHENDRLKATLKELEEKIQGQGLIQEVQTNLQNRSSFVEQYLRLLADIPLDALRRIRVSGKLVLECETLSHCFHRYGGEFGEIFSTVLISPLNGAEAALASLVERRDRLRRVRDIINHEEQELTNQQTAFANLERQNVDFAVVQRNHKETARILDRVICRASNHPLVVSFVEKVLQYWLDQPYRRMIPESETVNGLSLRQYEEQLQSALDELRYYAMKQPYK